LQVARAKQGKSDYDESEEAEALHALLHALKEDCDFDNMLKYAKEAFHLGCDCLSLSDQALAFEAQGHAHYHMGKQETALTCHRCVNLLLLFTSNNTTYLTSKGMPPPYTRS
jgi:hypothetical protein